MNPEQQLQQIANQVRRGGAPKYHEGLKEQGKLFVRERLKLFLDPETGYCEDGMLANCLQEDLPADGVVTGLGKVHGHTVCFMANDTTVKAGSWGAKTVEKILRIQETAERMQVPLVYLVDSAGGRITDQVEMFPGRRHAGRIFYHQVRLSGQIPQVCILFGPSPAGAAYIPAFSDVVIMVDQNASAYLGSPRMAEMVIGEKVSLEAMGGAKMHCTQSGLGDFLVSSEEEAITIARRYLEYMPPNWHERPTMVAARPPKEGRDIGAIIPPDQNKPFNIIELINRLVDEGSFLELKRDFAKEIVVGFARLEGQAVGLIANQPAFKGGVLFVDSSDKAARFIWLCNAFSIPLLFLADVPGFMIGSAVEKQGIIRHGAKMISAVSEATVPKISVILRKCYGAGLYAMAGPAFEPDACLALPTAQIAIMGPEAAINAVYYNKIQAKPEAERQDYVAQLRREYAADIDTFRLASELIVDAVIPPEELRQELARRFEAYANKAADFPPRRNPVHPV